ncbi:MAG: hypothetical protein U0271_44590 [Polyangiaceae bacterium]
MTFVSRALALVALTANATACAPSRAPDPDEQQAPRGATSTLASASAARRAASAEAALSVETSATSVASASAVVSTATAPCEACPTSCQRRPRPLEDRCSTNDPPPEALLKLLSAKPYVEEGCKPEPREDLPTALRCSYVVLGVSAEVVVADPSAERVARWIMDAARYSPVLERLRETSPERYTEVLVMLGRQVRQQSSRIFPVSGAIVEDLGEGPTAFQFDRGVVTPCDKGNCRCRINSLTPRAYCRYREAFGEDFAKCLETYSGKNGDSAWRDECLANHVRSFEADANEHFRAKVYAAGLGVEKNLGARSAGGEPSPPKDCGVDCAPDRVVALFKRELDVR